QPGVGSGRTGHRRRGQARAAARGSRKYLFESGRGRSHTLADVGRLDLVRPGGIAHHPRAQGVLGESHSMSGKLGDILIAQGVIDEEKLIAALSDQRAFGGKLGRTLVDLGYVNEEQLMRALAEQLGLETVDLDNIKVTDEALSALPVDACERYGVFPLRVDAAEKVL